MKLVGAAIAEDKGKAKRRCTYARFTTAQPSSGPAAEEAAVSSWAEVGAWADRPR
jgi:hypothetical protein